MNLYEFNQACYASLPDMETDEILTCKKTILAYLKDFPSNYYMLVNNEARYYTLFTFGKDSHDEPANVWMADALLKVVMDLGKIKSIERNGPMVEFWIADEDGNCKMYPFFDYAKGVIEI